MKNRHTPTPWLVWRLSSDIDPQSRHILTTADTNYEITSIIHRPVDAEHIAHCVNQYDRLVRALQQAQKALDSPLTTPAAEWANIRLAVDYALKEAGKG